jgi:hypothetical protein
MLAETNINAIAQAKNQKNAIERSCNEVLVLVADFMFLKTSFGRCRKTG